MKNTFSLQKMEEKCDMCYELGNSYISSIFKWSDRIRLSQLYNEPTVKITK